MKAAGRRWPRRCRNAACVMALALAAGFAPAQPQASGATTCTADPLGGRALYLRGSFNSWSVDESQRFTWACDHFQLVLDLQGEHSFKVGDADWSADGDFGRGADDTDLVRRGGNLSRRFTDRQRARLRFDAGLTRGELRFEPCAGATPACPPPAAEVAIDDPVARSLHFDSRDPAHKVPFGAQPAGRTLRFAVAAAPGVSSLTLIVEQRQLEGNQDRLIYTPLARVPMKPRRAGGTTHWQASHRFDGIGVYGYWFEARIGDRTYVVHNNRSNLPWTRERGSGGVAVVTAMPASAVAIRRFRQTVYDPSFQVPTWAADAVYYQIFPDRFRNGDPRNDPRPGTARYQGHDVEHHPRWLEPPYRPGSGDGSDAVHNNDFFGGDLAGITARLDHIRKLGANTLYLNPIFEAPSNHKYDTADYRHVDPALGSDADFDRLVAEARRRGLRVVLDTSFNHVGSDSIYFDRYARHPGVGAFEGGRIRADSPYASWFRFDPSQSEPDRQYKGWGGPDLPEVDEGSPAFRDFAFGADDAVTRHWLRRGAAGWRMDVAPWVPDDFWRAWRRAVKATQPQAVTVAETWFDASKYLLGDMFDATMNYVWRNAILDFAGGGPARDLAAALEHLREAYPPQALHAAMNLLSSHDVARALHVLGWTTGPAGEPAAQAAKRRLRLATLLQMGLPGAPSVYYGDEVGMTGGDDPFNRGPFPWPDEGGQPDLDLLADTTRMIALRHDHPVLRRGRLLAPLHADDQVLVLARRWGRDWALVAVNNGAAPRRVVLRLPAGAPERLVPAAGGAPVRARGGQLALELPAVGGGVWLGR